MKLKRGFAKSQKNTYFGYVRKEIRQKQLRDRLKGTIRAEDFSKRVEDRELLHCIQEILKACDKRARDIVLYRIYAGLKFQEIARLLHIKESTAKVIFYRTKVSIQKQLTEGEVWL